MLILSHNAETYPGEAATAAQVLRLAEEYRSAAQVLRQCGRRHDPLSLAPYRLSAIQSIELHLNAFLLHVGYEPSSIRDLQHDLSKRTKLAIDGGIQFRKKTTAHLSAITESKEYLVTRYAPEMTSAISQIERLTATLKEVACKVNTAMKVAHRPGASPTAQVLKSVAGSASIA